MFSKITAFIRDKILNNSDIPTCTCDPLNYIMNDTILIVSICMKNPSVQKWLKYIINPLYTYGFFLLV